MVDHPQQSKFAFARLRENRCLLQLLVAIKNPGEHFEAGSLRAPALERWFRDVNGTQGKAVVTNV